MLAPNKSPYINTLSHNMHSIRFFVWFISQSHDIVHDIWTKEIPNRVLYYLFWLVGSYSSPLQIQLSTLKT